MQKTKAGFSYVEVLMASALFAIVLLGVLSLTLGARQNIAFARENQRLSMAASSLSLAVRDLALSGVPITYVSINNLAQRFGVENYSVYVFGVNGEHRPGSPFHSSEYSESINLSGFWSIARGRESYFVYVVVRNDHDAPVGRAISVAIGLNHTSGIWRNAGG